MPRDVLRRMGALGFLGIRHPARYGGAELDPLGTVVLAEELGRFLRGEPIHARPVTVLSRTWRWCKRNPVVSSLTAGLLVALVAGFGFFRVGRGGDFTGNPPGLTAIKDFIVDPAFWIMSLLFALGISSTLGVYTMLPLFLVNEHGLERDLANTIVGMSRISGLFMALAGGWASDRFGPRKVMIAVFLLTGVTTVLMGAASNRWVLAAVFVQPLLAVCFFPAGFAALSRIGPAGSRNLAVSLTIPIAFLLGGGAVPSLIGYMGDMASFAAGIMLVGAVVTGGALLASRLRFR